MKQCYALYALLYDYVVSVLRTLYFCCGSEDMITFDNFDINTRSVATFLRSWKPSVRRYLVNKDVTGSQVGTQSFI